MEATSGALFAVIDSKKVIQPGGSMPIIFFPTQQETFLSAQVVMDLAYLMIGVLT